MSDPSHADAAKAGEIAQQIVAILTNQDSETRRRAIHAAMVLLGETASLSAEQDHGSGDSQATDLAQFFGRDEKLKPSDHAQLCAAFHFSQYGTASFTLDELRAIAGEAGVVLPDRLDMTLTQASTNGKKMFQALGKGMFKPTAAAALAFKERWNVRPGKIVKKPTAIG